MGIITTLNIPGIENGYFKLPQVDGIPRRCRIDLLTAAELAIYHATQAVEDLPADVRLTEAVILLSRARDKVADFIDQVPEPKVEAQAKPEQP